MSDHTDPVTAAASSLAAATLEPNAVPAPTAAPANPFTFGSASPPLASAPFSFGATSFGSNVPAPSFSFGAAAASSSPAAAPNPFATSSFAVSTDTAAAPFTFSAGSFSGSSSLGAPLRSSHGGKQRRSPAKHPPPPSSAASCSSVFLPAYDPDAYALENPFETPVSAEAKPTYTDINDALKSTAKPKRSTKQFELAAAWAKNQLERTMDQTNAKNIAAEAEAAAAAAAAAVAAAAGSATATASSSSVAPAAPAAAVYSPLNIGHTSAWLSERDLWDRQDAHLSPGSSTASEIRSLLNDLNVASVLSSIIVSFVQPPESVMCAGFFPEERYPLRSIQQMDVPPGATLVAAAVDVVSTHLAQVQLCLRELHRAHEREYDATMALHQARCDNHLHKQRCSSCGVSPIRGLCWRCEVCSNLHLCNACCQANAEPQHHLRSHPLIRLTGVASVVPAGANALSAASVAPASASPSFASLDASEGSVPCASSCSPPPDAALLRPPPKNLLSELSVCWHHPSRGQFATSLAGWRSLSVFDLDVLHPPQPSDWIHGRSVAERALKAKAEAEWLLANPPIPPAVLQQHVAMFREVKERHYRLWDDPALIDTSVFLRDTSSEHHMRGVTVRSAVIFFTRSAVDATARKHSE